MDFQNNICMFSPNRQNYDSLNTINFVYEKEEQKYTKLKIESVYKMHYVCSGTGFLHTNGKKSPLSMGDVFFTMPGMPLCIESESDFSYMYISFVGTKGNMLMEMLKVSESNLIFSGYNDIFDVWKKGFEINFRMTDIISESVLLYTFACIGNKIFDVDKTVNKNTNSISLIKKYIDDNFSDSNLSLETISKELNYNQKYISSLFKKHMKIGFAEYLNTIRIQHACAMMQQEYSSVSNIARLCGYQDPLYFSKIFKKKTGVSPREYIKSL